MIYRIVNKGKKFAYQVKNREDFLSLRNSKKNLDNLAKARKGDDKAKAQLVQFAYNIGVLQSSALAGCKSIGSYFFHDVDCYDAAQSAAMAKQILAKKDEIGLMMLEKSASGGYHLVCKREPGTSILENQVRVSSILQIEMDTNVHDLQRVSYSSSGDEKDLLYLDDELFEEPMTAEECEAEYERLKERERRGEEDVPAGAKKARKHYKPWEEILGAHRCDKGQGPVTSCDRYQSPVTYPDKYHGIPFTTIIKKYWEMNNGGFEPNVGDRDTLTYQLASDLRHICARNAEWLDQVIPCYDGFPIEEKRQKIANALKSSYEGMPGRLKDVLDALEGRKAKCLTSRI